MLFEQIILYATVLLVIAAVCLFLKKIYKKRVAIIKSKENRKEDESYKEKKRRELEKHKEILRDNQKSEERVYQEDLEIVDIAKPVGKWTKMVMQNGELMLRLAQLIKSDGGKKGFWELFVRAQASTQGKYKGKGR